MAVVGIDGSGKTSAVRALEGQMRTAGHDTAAMYCPRYHEGQNTPLQTLSRQLDALSATADDLRRPELKAAALYLQLTLFGPVERFILDTFRPRFLVSDRHALVDTLIYGPFYRGLIDRSGRATVRDESNSREALEARMPGAYDGIHTWLRAERRRTGLTDDLTSIMDQLRWSLNQPAERLMGEFGALYRTALPDVVVLLDADADEAAGRLAARSGRQPTTHEDSAELATLRHRYRTALHPLGSWPGTSVHEVRTQGRSVEDVAAEVGVASGLPVQPR